jgi:hypothetical protein
MKYVDLRSLESNATETTTFTRDYLEFQLGRKFTKVQDNASKYEEDGKGYSFLLELGSGNASTRFQAWVTQRRASRIDLYIGNSFISDGTIQIDTLSEYRKGNDRGAGNEYRNVPLYKVVEFFEINELITEDAHRVTIEKEEVLAC